MDTLPKSEGEPAVAPRVEFSSDVLQQIRQHARSSMRAEICGVLIGRVADGLTRVTARIAGEGASEGGAHVTFTQDTWEHIYKVKDKEFPDHSIVGWYHSHPGFGIFLSDYDLFIHENFFNAPHQVAWVFDPHSDEEGCFGWIGKKVEPLAQIAVLREHRAPAPEQTQEEAASHRAGGAGGQLDVPDEARPSGRIGVILLVAMMAFAGGVVFPTCLLIAHDLLLAMLEGPARQGNPHSMVAPAQNPAPANRNSAPAILRDNAASPAMAAAAPAPAAIVPPPPVPSEKAIQAEAPPKPDAAPLPAEPLEVKPAPAEPPL